MPSPKDPQKREEWLRNLSKSHMGQVPGNKGTKHTAEARAKMSIAHIGKTLSDEARAKVGEASRNQVRQPLPDATKAKISAAKTGKKYPNHKGHPQSPEMRAKIKAHYASLTPEEQGLLNEKRLKAVRTKGTDLELYIAHLLDAMGAVYEQQRRIGRYVVDFLVPEQQLILEVNGCFWHGCKHCGYDTSEHAQKREADMRRTAFLEKKGYVVVVLWQHDLLPFMKAERRGKPDEQTP